jgi:hypothetical protein
MLFILIPLVWLAVATLVVAACQTASRAERGDGARREDSAAGGSSALRADIVSRPQGSRAEVVAISPFRDRRPHGRATLVH